MRYYIYFDRYRRARKAITERELEETYHNDPDKFLRAMAALGPDGGTENAAGHVGTMSFETEKEMREFLETMGDEIIGLYEGESGARPYNF